MNNSYINMKEWYILKDLIFGDSPDNCYELNHRYEYRPALSVDNNKRPAYYRDEMILEGLFREVWEIRRQAEELKDPNLNRDIKECIHAMKCVQFLYSWKERHKHRYKTKEKQEEWFSKCLGDYEKHIKNHGFQGLSGQKGRERFLTYLRTLTNNLQRPKNVRRKTEFGRLVKLEFLGMSWGSRFDFYTFPSQAYFFNSKEITYHEYCKLLADRLKANEIPVVKMSWDNETWEEVGYSFGTSQHGPYKNSDLEKEIKRGYY